MIYGYQKNYKKKKTKIITLTVFTIIFTLFFSLPSNIIFVEAADTIIVDDDVGGGDYTSIQTAINNAGIGDYIVVKDGTYSEQITINVASLSIVAASGETPVLYLSSFNVGIDVTVPDVLIDGFEIFGNISTGFNPAIRASSGSNGLSVTNNEFKVFTSQVGSLAFQIMDTVTGVYFFNNIITDYDNGILMDGLSRANVYDNNFINVNSDYYHIALINGFVETNCYGSIQYAIDNGLDGDTIYVHPGTYIERLVIDKQLTFHGFGADTIVQPDDIPVAGVYDVEIDANNTSINNFLFDFNGAGDGRSGYGIVVSDLNDPPVIDVTISNNIIQTGDANTGIQTGKYSDVSGLTIYNNIFYGDDDGMGEGIYVNPFSGSDKVYIDNNQFYGNLFSAVSIETSNVTVTDNIIDSNVSKGLYGIRFYDYTGGQTYEDVSIVNNNIQNVTYGIRVGTSTDVGSILTSTIESNSITNNDIGIWIRYGANLSDSIHDNNLTSNSVYAINNVGNTLVNATDNWWGNLTGPYHPIDNPSGSGVNVSDNVTFWPWYEFDGYSVRPDVDYQVSFPKVDDGLYIKSSTVIDIDASDDESGLKNLTYRTWNTTHYWTKWNDFTSSINLVGDGKHMVQYNATDMAGTKNSDINIHYVDDSGPWVEVIYPNGGEFIRGDLNIEWDAADKTPDQHQTKTNGSYPLTADYPGHIQSFIPTNDVLNAIDLTLYGDEADVSITVFSEISPVPIPIGTSSKIIEGDILPKFFTFTFDSDIPLVIGEEYYIGVSQEIIDGTGIKWYYFNSTGGTDPYPNGGAWVKKTDALEFHPEIDWSFKTNYWNEEIYMDIQYTRGDPPVWNTIAEDEVNDGEFLWDTSTLPDDTTYKIRIKVKDLMLNENSDISDNSFIIDNTGPSVYNAVILDTTIDSTEYTTNGNRLEISANVYGEISNITADLSGFGKGSSVEPNSLFGDTATWVLNSINCAPANGDVSITITVADPNDDIAEASASITADNSPPEIEILRPLPGIYILDGQRLLPYPYPVIIGQITIRADASDVGAGINNVEFYVDNSLRESINGSDAIFEYVWDEASIGFFRIEVIAYDNMGFNSTAMVNDVFIVNFDVWD